MSFHSVVLFPAYDLPDLNSFGPQSFVELKHVKAIDSPKLFEHPVITEIAAVHNRTPAQVLLRWATQRGIAVIPKTNHSERLPQNLECTSFKLTDEEMGRISGLNRNLRFNNPADVSKFHSFDAGFLAHVRIRLWAPSIFSRRTMVCRIHTYPIITCSLSYP
jgi:hypothetical protein